MADGFQKEIPLSRINISVDLHTGDAQKKVELPLMPSFQQGSFARKFYLHPDGDPDTPLAGQRFRLHLPDGSTTEGVTDTSGMSSLFNRDDIENLRIEALGPRHD